MRNSLVTVFGGSGFLGRHLVRRLAAQGRRVRVAVRDVQAAAYLKPMGDLGQIVLVPMDIRDDAQVAAAVEGADAVVNLVGILYESGRQRFQALHTEAPARIGRAAAAAGVKSLVHVSALGANPASASAYARSKAEGEERLRRVFPGAVILRPSVVFGPEDDFFNRFAAMAKVSPVLPLIGPCPFTAAKAPGTRFQPVYVGDVAEAIARALTMPSLAGQTLELAGPKVMSLRDVLTLVTREARRPRPLMPIPFPLAGMIGAVAGCLPKPPLTRDQVTLLKTDNVAGGKLPGFEALGITPQAPEALVGGYLARYRPVTRQGG